MLVTDLCISTPYACYCPIPSYLKLTYLHTKARTSETGMDDGWSFRKALLDGPSITIDYRLLLWYH
nr:hypothetical protein ABT39_MTgene1016 [Picea glauca]